MQEEVTVWAGCECGERYPVPIAGADLRTTTFTCPNCGKTEGFTDDQIRGLKAHFGDAVGPIADAGQEPSARS